jgi:hypothetical protein
MVHCFFLSFQHSNTLNLKHNDFNEAVQSMCGDFWESDLENEIISD